MKKMKDGMKYDQKDIVLIPFPYTDLTISKKRPALIISNKKINKMQDRICCLITSKIHKNDLLINKNAIDWGTLPFKSSVKPHRIFTINEKIILKKICSVSSDFHKKVVSKMNEYICD